MCLLGGLLVAALFYLSHYSKLYCLQDGSDQSLRGVPVDIEDATSGDDACETKVHLYLYGGWALAVLILLSLQWLILSIFKAYSDELKPLEPAYAPLASEDTAV